MLAVTLDAYLPGLAPTLCETFPPSQPHRPTSIAAAKAVAAKAPSQAQRILEYLKRCGERGATLAEISEGLGISINATCGRTWSLKKAGHIRNAGFTRKNASGCEAEVMVANDGR